MDYIVKSEISQSLSLFFCFSLSLLSSFYSKQQIILIVIVILYSFTSHFNSVSILLMRYVAFANIPFPSGNPLQYSCLWNPMDRGAWHATVPWGCKEKLVGHHKRESESHSFQAWKWVCLFCKENNLYDVTPIVGKMDTEWFLELILMNIFKAYNFSDFHC